MSLLEMIRANPIESVSTAKGTLKEECQAAFNAAKATTPAPTPPALTVVTPAKQAEVTPAVQAMQILLSGTAYDGTRMTADIINGRIYLSFARKPDARTIERIKVNERFWWSRELKQWHQIDSTRTRDMLTREFGIRFATTQTVPAAPATPAAPPSALPLGHTFRSATDAWNAQRAGSIQVPAGSDLTSVPGGWRFIAPDEAPPATPAHPVRPLVRVPALSEALPPDMERYKQQVDGLISALGITAAELMIVAIQHLHDTTFPK